MAQQTETADRPVTVTDPGQPIPGWEDAYEALADEVDRQAAALRDRGWDAHDARQGALDNVVDDRTVHADIDPDVPRCTVYTAVEMRLGFRGTAFEPATEGDN